MDKFYLLLIANVLDDDDRTKRSYVRGPFNDMEAKRWAIEYQDMGFSDIIITKIVKRYPATTK